MRHAIAMLVVLSASFALAADDKKTVNIEGTYLIVGVEIAGEKLPAELITKGAEAERTIVIKGDKLIASKGGKDDPATFKIDATKSPAHIDMIGKGPSGKEEKMYGIFKLDGDTLTICAAESDKAEDRPKEFKTAKDSKAMILTLKKKAK